MTWLGRTGRPWAAARIDALARRMARGSGLTARQEQVEAELRQLRQVLERLEQERAAKTPDQVLLAAGLTARAQRLASAGTPPPRPPLAPPPLEQVLARLEGLNPRLFPLWRELFENARRAYLADPAASCSTREHRDALVFGAYLDIYGHGRLLDIGCGPFGLPSYLASRDPRLVSGLDPLPAEVPVSFERVQGFNEFLPWPDASFDAVVSATALDHVLCLETSLAEVCRVLRPGGHYLVWLASVPGAPAFDPGAESFAAIDAFHLFHFERGWVEPIFERYFDVVDITVRPWIGFDHVFYCLTPKPSAPRQGE